MTAGDTTVSGAFSVENVADIKTFVEENIASTISSGAQVFAYPAANGQQVYVGVVEGEA